MSNSLNPDQTRRFVIPTLIICLLGNFSYFLSSAIFFQNQLFRKILSRIVGRDLGPNCLQRLSAGKELTGTRNSFTPTDTPKALKRGCIYNIDPHRRHCVVVLEQDTFILA